MLPPLPSPDDNISSRDSLCMRCLTEDCENAECRASARLLVCTRDGRWNRCCNSEKAPGLRLGRFYLRPEPRMDSMAGTVSSQNQPSRVGSG